MFNESSLACEELNAKLPLPKSQLEMTEFSQIIKIFDLTYASRVVLDLTDYANEKKWLDNNGQNVTYFNWAKGEPSNSNFDKDYAAISYEKDTWGDWNSGDSGKDSNIS